MSYISPGQRRYDNYENYDSLLTKPSPQMLIGFNGNGEDGTGWGEAKLVCPTLNRFAEGTRIPPEAESDDDDEDDGDDGGNGGDGGDGGNGALSTRSPSVLLLALLAGSALILSY